MGQCAWLEASNSRAPRLQTGCRPPVGLYVGTRPREALLPPTCMTCGTFKRQQLPPVLILPSVTTAPRSSTCSNCANFNLVNMADTDAPTQPMHVGMLLRCFLCHEKLPEPDWNTKGTYPEWKGPLISGTFIPRTVVRMLAHYSLKVFPFQAQDGSVRQQLRSAHIQKTKLRYSSKMRFWSSNALAKELSIQPCDRRTLCGDYCPHCRPDRMVYLSHRDCWKVAFSDSHMKVADWSRLATQTRPYEIVHVRHKDSVGCDDYQSRTVLPPMPPDPDQLQRGTSLGGLLSKVRFLPTEIQFQIMGLVKGTMVASLLQAKAFVSELLPRLRARSNWTLQPETKALRVGCDESSVALSCCSTYLMGRSYLSDLALRPLKESTAQVVVANIAVRGLQFALGRFGLRGVRISYDDGSFSPWLGDSTSCWVGTIRCSDLSKLNIVANVSYLKVAIKARCTRHQQVEIRCSNKTISQEWQILRVDTGSGTAPSSKTQAMWYGGCPPTGISTRLVTPKKPKRLHYYPNWKQCQYLPLNFGAEYASGLTIYIGSTEIIGIVSHGPSDFVFGEAEYEESHEETFYSHGIPIHFPLGQGEYLTSAWLHTTWLARDLEGLLAVRFTPPCVSLSQLLMVALGIKLRTNFDRVQHFGAYQLPEQANIANDLANEIDDSAWVRLSMERPAEVYGLAFDVLSYTCKMKTIRDFGVCQDASIQPDIDEVDKPPRLPIHPNGPTLPTPSFLNYLRQLKTTYCLSTASLNDIATLHVRKKMIWMYTGIGWVCGCTGLRIVHLDSSIEILGRWDPRDKHSISRLYDSSQGALMTVTFHMAYGERSRYVENITIGVTDNPWDYQPPDPSLVVPTDPPSHPWNCELGEYPTALTDTRIFDCSQGSQVCTPLTLHILLGSKFHFLTSPKRAAWWFTAEYDDIGRDHGTQGVQIREETDLYFGEEYEAMEIE